MIFTWDLTRCWLLPAFVAPWTPWLRKRAWTDKRRRVGVKIQPSHTLVLSNRMQKYIFLPKIADTPKASIDCFGFGAISWWNPRTKSSEYLKKKLCYRNFHKTFVNCFGWEHSAIKTKRVQCRQDWFLAGKTAIDNQQSATTFYPAKFKQDFSLLPWSVLGKFIKLNFIQIFRPNT